MKKIALLTFIYMLSGCKKDEKPEPPIPDIVINTPAENQHFVKGDTIRITGTITCTNQITEVAVHMTNINTNFEFFHNHFSGVNTTSYNFSARYGIPDLNKATYKVEVQGNDKDGNLGTKEIMVTVN